MRLLIQALIIVLSLLCVSLEELQKCWINLDVTECENVQFKQTKPLKIEDYTAHLKLSIDDNIKELPPRVFALVSNITNLSISNSPLETISAHAFDNLKQLKHLSIHWNQIKELPPYIFQSCCTHLSSLNVSGNAIEYIAGDVFQPLLQLRSLNLTWNILKNVPTLETLSNLRFLDLSNNQITNLHGQSFKGLDNLENLNLKGNNIRHISQDAFAGLVHVHFLNIEKNELSTINITNMRNNLKELEEIKLAINPFPCTVLKSLVDELLSNRIVIRKGLAERGDITYHGIFCIFDRYDEIRKNRQQEIANLMQNNSLKINK